jgi:hypothetical protein
MACYNPPVVIMSSAPFMRFVALLLLLSVGLAGCAVGGFPGVPPAPEASATAAAPVSAGGASGARGGASTAAARAAADPDAPTPSADPVTQARADCWMKVEGQRALRGIDQRIAFVDKCVAGELKNGPKS